MSALSLLPRPGVLTVTLQPTAERSPTDDTEVSPHGFGNVLKPRYIFGADPLDQ